MSKSKTKFFCSQCGHETSGWLGKCPGCGSWNTIVEEKFSKSKEKSGRSQSGWTGGSFESENESNSFLLSDIDMEGEKRFVTGIYELDRVLGGGFVRGSLVLVGGDPGIGKSTLLMQVCGKNSGEDNILYVSGEESPGQIRMRAQRLGVKADSIRVFAQTSFEAVANEISKQSPEIAIIDSIQTMYTDEVSSAPGSVSQVREVAFGLLRIAKNTGTTIVLVGHVTKDGAIAGPRVLEHMVDTVLYFEGERQSSYRILRAVKNRFGATDEIGIFEMTEKGLIDVENASSAMLEGRPIGVPGTVVTSCMEGTRPILIEIQSLLSPTSYGTPQRMTQGLDRGRVSMILAVLDSRLSLGVSQMDAFINIVGGIKSDETALDLAVVAAVVSCVRMKPVKPGIIVFGEVGLTGEIRPVSNLDRRINEARRMGFKSCILPGGSRKHSGKAMNYSDFELLYVDSIGEMIDVLF